MVSLIPVSRPQTSNALNTAVMMGPIMDRAWFTNNGPKVRRFEARVAERLRVPHFVAMANGTLALEAAISMLFKEGSVIAIPSYTFVAVASAVVRCGCKPLFIDIDRDTWTMSYDGIVENIVNIAGVIVPNVFGAPPDPRFSRMQLPVVYDNAEGFGTHTGLFGTIDTYSFHATKIVNCAEGGGIACMKEGDKKYLSMWRDFGFDGAGGVACVGTNAKMSEFHAALGNESLKHEAWQITHRIKAFGWYRERLVDLVDFQDTAAPYNCVILTKNRDNVATILGQKGIDSREYFYPIHLMKPYQDFERGQLKNTEEIASMALALPLWAGIQESTVDQICNIVREAQKWTI